jgi:hypothetical protein
MYLFDEEIRLTVGTGWQTLEVLSEVGIAFTFFGFTPAIIVSRDGARHILLVGAKSLAGPLKSIIDEEGKLTGSVFRCRKTSLEKTSVYEVEFLK